MDAKEPAVLSTAGGAPVVQKQPQLEGPKQNGTIVCMSIICIHAYIRTLSVLSKYKSVGIDHVMISPVWYVL